MRWAGFVGCHIVGWGVLISDLSWLCVLVLLCDRIMHLLVVSMYICLFFKAVIRKVYHFYPFNIGNYL